jgi:hypothetical protein
VRVNNSEFCNRNCHGAIHINAITIYLNGKLMYIRMAYTICDSNLLHTCSVATGDRNDFVTEGSTVTAMLIKI